MTGPAPASGADRGDPELAAGVIREVAAGVRRLIAPNAGLMTGPGTNTYLLGEDQVAVIDPGPDDDNHLAAIAEAVGDRLRWIVVTHTHTDHSPLSGRLAELTGAETLGFGPAPAIGVAGAHHLDAHDQRFDPDRRMGDGDELRTAELTLEAVHTPGHTSNHLCFRMAGTGLLFSGDHVMAGSTVVIAPPDGDMAEYFVALERVRDLDPRRIAPGHGGMIEDPGAVLDDYLTHRHARERQVLGAVRDAAARGATAEAIVAALYTDVPDALHPVARYSVWAHLRKLAGEGKVSSADADEIGAPWWEVGVPADQRRPSP